jgi:L-erythro-3,5-diaminohexanoate dehydrogenase
VDDTTGATPLKACEFGSHRAGGQLPQNADRLDATPDIWPNELLIDVDLLNLDSASMHQLVEESAGDVALVCDKILKIVRDRGKMHNPVTGSGGIFSGRVAQVGTSFPDQSLRLGDRIVSLVSLSLVPLQLRSITSVDLAKHQVRVEGTAIVFSSGLFAREPQDINPEIALALFDVAGAPATLLRVLHPRQKVIIIGAGGKAGLLCAVTARETIGQAGLLIGVEPDARAAADLRSLNVCDEVVVDNACDPIRIFNAIERLTNGALADVVVNVTNASMTEGATILATRQLGTAYFFGMCTSFQRVALTAEGVGKDITLLVGNGYVRGWTESTLRLFRDSRGLQNLFAKRYASNHLSDPAL